MIKITIKRFWDIIEESRKETSKTAFLNGLTDYTDILLRIIENKLAVLDVSEIALWNNIFYEYRELAYKPKLWAAAFIIEGGCSDDGFMDFRAGLIAHRKKAFLKALADPESVGDLIGDLTVEEMNYVGGRAYGKRVNPTKNQNNWDDCDDEFDDELEKFTLSEQMKKEILSEICYAKDIDTEWGGFHKSEEEIANELKLLVPKLYEKFWSISVVRHAVG